MKQSFPILSRSDEPIIINHYEPLWLALWTITIMNQSSITGWWFESLWTTLVNGKDDIPYIMENIKCSKPPTSDIWLIIDCLIILIVTWEFASHYEPINQIMNIEKLIVSRWHPLWLWTNQPDYEPPTSDIWLIIDCLIILIVTREFSSHYEPINQIMNIEKLIVSPWHPLWLWTNQPDYEPPTSDIWLIIDCLIILIVTWEFASHYEPINQIMNIEKLIVSRWHPLWLWTNQPDYEPPTSDIWLIIDCLIILIVTWKFSSHYEPINQIMNVEKLIVSRWHPLWLWTNQPDYEPPTSDIWLIIDCLIILIVTWEISSHYEPINQIMRPNILNQSTIMIMNHSDSHPFPPTTSDYFSGRNFTAARISSMRWAAIPRAKSGENCWVKSTTLSHCLTIKHGKTERKPIIHHT